MLSFRSLLLCFQYYHLNFEGQIQNFEGRMQLLLYSNALVLNILINDFIYAMEHSQVYNFAYGNKIFACRETMLKPWMK